MEEPPDPGGSTSSVPHPAYFITVKSNESGMETDGSLLSISSGLPVKRSRTIKMCRHCNKRRRKRNSASITKEDDCLCTTSETIKEKVISKELTTISIPQVESFNTTSVNNTLLHPPTQPVGRSTYEATDIAPYIVHIQKIQSSPNDNVILHPIAFGRFLKTQGFSNIVNGSLQRIGRNRMSLAFTDFDKANIFLRHESLEKNKFKAFIPTYNLTRMGLVRGVPAEWSIEEVMENITVPIGCGKILKIRRLNYKTNIDGTPTWKPSQTVVLTFDGQVLPKRIYMCYNALSVELYTYPTVQCYNCCRFGHTKLQCRSKPRCYKCGLEHTAESCTVNEDCASCCLCSGLHFATSKACPEYSRQKNIKQSMSEQCISYSEAGKLHPPVYKSYAEVVTSNRPTQAVNKVSFSPSSSPLSYRKTIIKKPRSPHQSSKGYNVNIHNEIIKDYNLPAPTNGCALKSKTLSDKEPSLVEVIMLLISILSQSNLLKSDHVAPMLEIIKQFSQTNNGFEPSDSDKQ